MWKLKELLFFVFILHNVHTKNLRKDPDLLTFNTEENKDIAAKIQDEAVIISLWKVNNIKPRQSREHVLFGFDIFNFVPENFRVSVNYHSKILFLNLTSTISSTSMEINLEEIDEIDSLFLRLGDEDNTVSFVLNCEVSHSIVTPMNLIKFFRSVATNKFKILFDRRYELRVFTEDDDMEMQLQEKCNFLNLSYEYKLQREDQLQQFAVSLTKYTPHLTSMLQINKVDSELAVEIFIKSFLSKDVFHQSSHVYTLVHLIQSLTRKFPEVFQPNLQRLFTKIFWTNGKEHVYARKSEIDYLDDLRIRENLFKILFANSPRTFMDSVRKLKDVGKRFRDVFANPTISINKVMRNATNLKYTLLDIVFEHELDQDQLDLLSPTHIINTMFVNYYLIDLHVDPKTLNDIHKRIIFNADRQDYITIGKFIRYIYLKDLSQQQAHLFVESDLKCDVTDLKKRNVFLKQQVNHQVIGCNIKRWLTVGNEEQVLGILRTLRQVIGMRVALLLSYGQVKENLDIHWAVRNLITKKDVDLPHDLEYQQSVIVDTLSKCYSSPATSRNLFMLTLENLFIYNYANFASYLNSEQGIFIYNLYRDLILNDIQKKNSVLKKELLKESPHIHEMIRSIIYAIVNNIDEISELRQMAVEFVNNTLSYANVDAKNIIKSEADYVTIFKKIVGESSKSSIDDMKVDFKIFLLRYNSHGAVSLAKAVGTAASRLFPEDHPEINRHLVEAYERYNSSAEKFLGEVDEILDEGLFDEHFEKIVKQDLEQGVKFHDESLLKEPETIFQLSEDEDELIKQERYKKMRELDMLEKWFRAQVRYYTNPNEASGQLGAKETIPA